MRRAGLGRDAAAARCRTGGRGATLLVALPIAAGHPVDPAAVGALAIVQPMALTAVGVTISLGLLGVLLGARTPRGLLRAARSLRLRPAPAPAQG